MALGSLLMPAGVVLHLAESHGHEHAHEALEHEHSHRQRHEPLQHAHPHVPDAHHAHRH